MKTTILFLALVFSPNAFTQNSARIEEDHDIRILTLNPSQKIHNTAGINIGILDDYHKQTVNGLNLQLNPLSILYPLVPKAIPSPTEQASTVTVNGLHISTGGMMDGKKLNGVGISMYHHATETNGFTANFFNNTSAKLNGAHVSIMTNNSECGSGMTISILGNYSNNYHGIQISGDNIANKMTGLQIGIVNKSRNLRGIQIGLWNINEKRKLPIMNWNFSAVKNKKKLSKEKLL